MKEVFAIKSQESGDYYFPSLIYVCGFSFNYFEAAHRFDTYQEALNVIKDKLDPGFYQIEKYFVKS